MMRCCRSVLLAGCAIVVACFILWTLPVNAQVSAEPETPFSIVEGWQYRWGDPVLDGRPVDSWLSGAEADSDAWKTQKFPGPAPGRQGEKNMWQRVRVPQTAFANPSLYILGVDQNMEVYLDQELVYHFGSIDQRGQGRFQGYPWHIVPLPSGAVGRMLSFRIWADHVNIGLVGEVNLGTDGMFIKHMVRNSANPGIVAVAVSFIGLASLLMFALKPSNREYLHFGILAFSIGVYVFTRTELKQFVVSGDLLRMHVELAALYFTCYACVAFVDRIFPNSSFGFLRWVWRLELTYSFISLPLAMLGVVPTMATLLPVQLIILITIPVILVVVARRAMRGDREALFMVFGFASFLGASIMEIFISMGLILSEFMGALVVLPWGIVGMVGFFAWILIGRFLGVFHAVLEHKENLECLAQEGRRIGAMASFSELLRQLRESFIKVARIPLQMRVYFHRAAFVESDFGDGFVLMADSGDMADSTLHNLEALQATNRALVMVSDLRGVEPLAAIPIELESAGRKKVGVDSEKKMLDKLMALLEPMTNNVASAISTVKLEQTFGILEKRTQEIRTIFANINQGIVMLDDTLSILPEHSARVCDLFNTQDVAGRHIMEFAFAKADISDDLRSQIVNCLSGSLGEDVMNWETNNDVLPQEIRFLENGSERWFELDWTAIVGGDDVVWRLMLTFRDVTQLKILKAAAEANRVEMEIVHQIVSIPQEKFDSFMSSAKRYVDDSVTLICKDGGPSDEDLNEVKRNLHTVKGNSRTLKFAFLTSMSHEVESVVIDLIKDGAGVGGVVPVDALVGEIGRLSNLLERYQTIARDRLGRGGTDQAGRDVKEIVDAVIELARRVAAAKTLNSELRTELRQVHLKLVRLGVPTLHGVVDAITPSLEGLAAEIGRSAPQVKVLGSEDWVLGTDFAEALQGSLTHLMRNSLDHGFIDNRKGTIFIEPRLEGENATLLYWDNGAGLNLSRLLERALAKGLCNEGAHDNDLAQLVFVSGVSTAERVTDVSGRGVGMDAVRSLMKRVGADVVLEFSAERTVDDRRAFCMRFTFPMSHVKDRIAV